MAAGMSCKAHRSRALELAAGDGAGRADGYVVRNLVIGLYLGSSLMIRRANIGPSYPRLGGNELCCRQNLQNLRLLLQEVMSKTALKED